VDFFLDASIMVRLILNAEDADKAEDILSVIESGESKAYCTVAVLEEVAFKLFIAKASEILNTDKFFHIKRALKMKGSLRAKCCKVILDLQTYVDTLRRGGLRVVEIIYEDWAESIKYMQENGLLTSDALHLAVMHRHGLHTIASFDRDFRRVKGIDVIP